MSLVLASASPRRRELLARLGVQFIVDPANIDEPLPARHPRPERVARALACEKAKMVAERHSDALVLAADTLVIIRGELLGKPGTPEEARSMLLRLRGRWHRVITAVALARGKRCWVRHAVTWVRLRGYRDEEIAASVESGAPFDKAGGYAIQDPVLRPVAEWRGCYCNVVGLSLWLVWEMLQQRSSLLSASLPDLPDECWRCPLRPSSHKPGNGD